MLLVMAIMILIIPQFWLVTALWYPQHMIIAGDWYHEALNPGILLVTAIMIPSILECGL
jgi:hypothetical protein